MYSYKILQNWSKDLFHSSIVVFDKKSYLFNCCDGTQRNLSQQNIRFNKINHIFYNSSSIESYLGTYGFTMSRNEQIAAIPSTSPIQIKTKENSNKNNNNSYLKQKEKSEKSEKSAKLSSNLDDNNKQLYYWGPPTLKKNFDFCKHFFTEKVKDYIYICNPITNKFQIKSESQKYIIDKTNLNYEYKSENKSESKFNINLNLNEQETYIDYFEDENLKIFPISTFINNNDSQLNQNNTDCVLSYFCVPHLKPRSFLADKAKSLGLKPGPEYKKLQDGKSVFLENGFEIKPENVLGEQMPSSTFSILYSPTIEHSNNLIENIFNKKIFEKKEDQDLTLIVHILGDFEILNTNKYKEFLKKINEIHPEAINIIDCKDTNFKFMLNEGKHKMRYLLNKAEKKLYKDSYFTEKETLPKLNLFDLFEKDQLNKINIINSNPGFEYNLYPHNKKKILKNQIYEPYIFNKKNIEINDFMKNSEILIEEINTEFKENINKEHIESK
jgi:ribonuclease BN (tRNA processing enzyme)